MSKQRQRQAAWNAADEQERAEIMADAEIEAKAARGWRRHSWLKQQQQQQMEGRIAREHKTELAAVQAHWASLPHGEAARRAAEAVNQWDGDTYEVQLAHAHAWARTAATPVEKALLLAHSRAWIDARHRWAQATPEKSTLWMAQAEQSVSTPEEKAQVLANAHAWEQAERDVERRTAQAAADERKEARKRASKDYWENVPGWVRGVVIIGTIILLYVMFGSSDQY